MATTAAESIARVGDRRRQLGTATRVAAHLQRLLGKFSQCNLQYENPSALLRAGLVRIGNLGLIWSVEAFGNRAALEGGTDPFKRQLISQTTRRSKMNAR